MRSRGLPEYLRWVLVVLLLCGASGTLCAAESVTGPQRDAAGAYFAALAGGDAQALAFAIHPDELSTLRAQLLARLRDEASHDDSTLRSRVFGSAMPLADLERMTDQSFFVALSRRLTFGGRAFRDVHWLGSVTESRSLVWVLGRLKPAKDHGKVEVVQMVGLTPYGKDWKAIIPTQMRAQIEDLLAGHTENALHPAVPAERDVAATVVAGGAVSAGGAGRRATAPHEVLRLLDDAEQALIAGKCGTYYKDFMSPNFRRLTPAKSLATLVQSCHDSLGTRETLIAGLRIVRTLAPLLELDGARASYDVSNQGLPYDHFVLEKLQDRWYIAE